MLPHMILHRGNIRRIFKTTLIIITACSWIATESASASASKKSTVAVRDTSVVNRHVIKSLEYAYHSKDIEKVRAHIDSAEAACVEDHIEFPTLLHLARAEYFYLTGDFRNASQEGTIAMNKARRNGDKEILARTLNFFARYSYRTGFYSESVDYFRSSIEMAEKLKMDVLVPWSYYGLATLYSTIGDTKEMINSFYNMIRTAALDNDTAFLKIGYYRLGTAYKIGRASCRERV